MYNKETKAIVCKLYKNLLKEKQKGSLIYSLHNPLKRASKLTGLNYKTLHKWIQDDKTDANSSALLREKPSQPFRKLDSFDVDIVKRKVKTLFDKRETVSLKKLMKLLEQEDQLSIKKSTLWKILRRSGFRFRKTGGNRKLLCERYDLQIARCKYLRELKQLTDCQINLVYLDETWINSHHTFSKEWISNDGLTGRNIPTGRGQRLILLHAVDTISGFLPGCKLLFKSHSTDGRDYHQEMNAVIFEDWVRNSLLPSLKEPSCIIMDNAPYHSRICPDTAAPTTKTNKAEMMAWLEKHNIPFDPHLLKPEIYEIIKKRKPPKEYVIDKLIMEHNHLVLRLPPYHSDLNPIELLWANIKGDVARNNTTFKLENVQTLTEEAINKISLDTIKSTFDHVKNIENEYWVNDGLQIAPIVETINIPLQESSSSSSNSSSDNSD